MITPKTHFKYHHRDTVGEHGQATFLLTEDFEIVCFSSFGDFSYYWSKQAVSEPNPMKFFVTLDEELLINKFSTGRKYRLRGTIRKELAWHWSQCKKQLKEYLNSHTK